MLKKASLSTLLVLLAWSGPALELEILSQPAERSSRCTVRCQSDPSIKCSSATGDCQYYAGGLNDWISCDGIQYECPFPEPPQ
jgi:hypothetical protein